MRQQSGCTGLIENIRNNLVLNWLSNLNPAFTIVAVFLMLGFGAPAEAQNVPNFDDCGWYSAPSNPPYVAVVWSCASDQRSGRYLSDVYFPNIYAAFTASHPNGGACK